MFIQNQRYSLHNMNKYDDTRTILSREINNLVTKASYLLNMQIYRRVTHQMSFRYALHHRRRHRGGFQKGVFWVTKAGSPQVSKGKRGDSLCNTNENTFGKSTEGNYNSHSHHHLKRANIKMAYYVIDHDFYETYKLGIEIALELIF